MALTRLPGFTIDSTSSFTFASTTVTANVVAGNIKTDNLLYANGTPWSFGTGGTSYSNSNVAAYLPTYTGNISANYYSGNGSQLTSITGANVTGQVSNSLIAGTVYTAAQPNITSVGTLTTLNVSGNVTSAYFIGDGSQLTGLPASYSNANVAAYLPTYTGNFTAGNISTTGNITSAYFIGNGSALTNINGSNVSGDVSGANHANIADVANSVAGGNVTGQVGNSLVAGTVYTNAQPNITSTGTLVSLNVTGNVSSGGNIIGNGQYLTSINGSNVTGTVANANYATYSGTAFSVSGSNVSGDVSGANHANIADVANSVAGGNVTGQVGNALVAGTVYSNAQPNITSTGTLVSLDVTGNVSSGGNIIGNGQYLTSITGANVTGTVANANYATYSGTAYSVSGSNVSGQVGNSLIAGTVYTNAQPNITSLGTLNGLSVGGNIDVTGNINVTGNLNYSNVTNLEVGDPLIYIGANNTGNIVDLGIVGSFNDGTYQHTGIARDHTDGIWKLFTGVTAEPTTTIDWANATYAGFKAGNITSGNASLGNLATASFFSGNGSLLTSITGANVSGDVSGANHANIADVANSVAGGNVTGQVGNALVAGTVYSNAQPNITSVGTLTSINVTGNVSSGGNIIGNGQYLTSLNGSNVIGTVANANYALYSGTAFSINGSNVSGDVSGANHANIADVANSVAGGNVTGQVGNALVAGTVYTAAQPNITSVGTLVSVSVTGNVSSGGNIIGNGQYLTSITGANVTGQVGNALVAGTVYTAAQPNITSTGTLSSLTVTGLITATAGGIKVGNLQDTSGTNTIQLLNSNVSVTGNIVAGTGGTGNVTATYFIGNGSQLTGLPASYSNTNVASYLPTYTGNFSPSNLVVSTSANLGAVGNIYIGGGSANYVLSTDGAGALSWVAQSGGNVTSTTISVDNFTGNGVADTYTLSVTPTSVNSVFVNYNGAFVSRDSYSLSGANITFGSIPANGSKLEITTIQGLTIGSGSFTTRTATGDNTTVNYTVTSGATESSVLVTLDGVVQTPTTDYTISGTTLTFTTAPSTGVAIQIRELSVASSSGGGASNASIRAQSMVMGIIFGG